MGHLPDQTSSDVDAWQWVLYGTTNLESSYKLKMKGTDVVTDDGDGDDVAPVAEADDGDVVTNDGVPLPMMAAQVSVPC